MQVQKIENAFRVVFIWAVFLCIHLERGAAAEVNCGILHWCDAVALRHFTLPRHLTYKPSAPGRQKMRSSRTPCAQRIAGYVGDVEGVHVGMGIFWLGSAARGLDITTLKGDLTMEKVYEREQR